MAGSNRNGWPDALGISGRISPECAECVSEASFNRFLSRDLRFAPEEAQGAGVEVAVNFAKIDAFRAVFG